MGCVECLDVVWCCWLLILKTSVRFWRESDFLAVSVCPRNVFENDKVIK